MSKQVDRLAAAVHAITHQIVRDTPDTFTPGQLLVSKRQIAAHLGVQEASVAKVLRDHQWILPRCDRTEGYYSRRNSTDYLYEISRTELHRLIVAQQREGTLFAEVELLAAQLPLYTPTSSPPTHPPQTGCTHNARRGRQTTAPPASALVRRSRVEACDGLYEAWVRWVDGHGTDRTLQGFGGTAREAVAQLRGELLGHLSQHPEVDLGESE